MNRNSSIAFIFFFFLIAVTAPAFGAEIVLGFSGGINAGWFSGSDWDNLIDQFDADNRAKAGFSLGGFLDIGLSENFSLQPELGFTVSGGGIDAKDLYDSYYDVFYDEEVTQTARLITLPVLAKFKLPAGRGKISFFAGPLIAFLLGDITLEDKVTVAGYGSDTEDYDLEADNSIIFGLAAGAGYEVQLGKGKLYTDLRFSHALTGFFDDDDTRANTLGINIGYGFFL